MVQFQFKKLSPVLSVKHNKGVFFVFLFLNIYIKNNIVKDKALIKYFIAECNYYLKKSNKDVIKHQIYKMVLMPTN